MISNREISRLFSLYAELLQLHNKNEGLANLLSGASYRIRRIDEPLGELKKDQLSKLFRPELMPVFDELKKSGTINDLDELVQLTPPGLFDMMRIRGLGGKKLSMLWRVAKIDTVEDLLEACKRNQLKDIPGFGAKTQQNIIEAIESERSRRDRFHFASVADDANSLVRVLQQLFGTKLVSLCGEIRRQSTTVGRIEIIAAVDPAKCNDKSVRRFMVIDLLRRDKRKVIRWTRYP